jgi:hypothetical protein
MVSQAERIANAKTRLYKHIDDIITAFGATVNRFRASRLGTNRQNQINSRGEMANAIIIRLPTLIDAYAQMVQAGEARPAIYSAKHVSTRIERILQRAGSSGMMERLLKEWLTEIRQGLDTDVTDDTMTEGWEA